MRSSALLSFLLVVAAVLVAPAARADEKADADRKAQARAAFEQGITLFDRGEYSAALADFMRSRALFPTRTATINAAVCMRKEGRYDEALDLVEELLRTFPNLPPTDRAFADTARAELRPLVGGLDIEGEPGATIMVDGRERGLVPTSSPVRVSAGVHVVHVYKAGFLPLERRVDVAGRQTVVLDANLAPLASSGELVVTDAGDRALEVLVDGVVVGKTPFSGRIATGRHAVFLRGEGDLGTAPVDVSVDPRSSARLRLSAEHLDSSLRVMPIPANALVSIDGVTVGSGVWEGRLRAGAHRIELAADGFLSAVRQPTLASGERQSLSVTLERDVTSSAFRVKNPPRIFVELDAGSGIGLLMGGDIRDACTGDCSAAVPTLLGLSLRAGWQAPSGLQLGLDAGVLAISAGVTGRAASLVPRGLAPNLGTVDDDLYLRGLFAGPMVGLRFGPSTLPITARLGAGLFFGSGGDNRRGSFRNAAGAYSTSSAESSSALYAWAGPEIRAAIPIGARLEASLGVTCLVLAALETPRWTDASEVLAAPAGQRGDGAATYGEATMTGSLVVALVPSIGLRAAF